MELPGRPTLRVASLRGGRGVDPAQVRLPEPWRALPTVVVGPGKKLEVEERSRGIGAEQGVQLALQRQVWLDFEGPGATLRDRLSGRMEREFRLDVAHPLVLTRATVAGEPVVVTRGARPDLTGVEVRRSYPELEATSRWEGGGWRLPVSGWQIPLEGADVQLHLPPGRVLVAAVPSGLLGTPDLHVVGNNSTPTDLRWFADRSDGPLPVAAAFTLPMWFYRLAMLAWALWLALAVVGWLRWGWACFTAGGGWRPRPGRPASVPPPSSGAPGGAAGSAGARGTGTAGGGPAG